MLLKYILFSCLFLEVVNSDKVHQSECHEVTVNIFENGESINGQEIKFCDEECLLNPVLADLLCTRINLTSKCTFFTETGVEVETCSDLSSTFDRTLFAVPEEKLFVFPPFEVGHKTVLDHIQTTISDKQKVVIETLSVSVSFCEIIVQNDKTYTYFSISTSLEYFDCTTISPTKKLRH